MSPGAHRVLGQQISQRDRRVVIFLVRHAPGQQHLAERLQPRQLLAAAIPGPSDHRHHDRRRNAPHVPTAEMLVREVNGLVVFLEKVPHLIPRQLAPRIQPEALAHRCRR
jgi:hypothetical protein